ncbi:MAG: HlyD family efflux transporter periplasmic adaptor subunit [Lentisphaeria bacterium]|nr:HlyD family efflux transporter periplasmic adaptor subunit [Lentisphaeria bacterium]
MAIRLRKIKQSRPKSKVEIKKEAIQRNSLWKSTKFIVFLIVIAIILVPTFMMLFAPIEAQILAEGAIVNSYAPVAGRVVESKVLPKGKLIPIGTTVLILQPVSGNYAEKQAALNILEEKAQKAKLDLVKIEFKQLEFDKLRKHEEIELKLKIQVEQDSLSQVILSQSEVELDAKVTKVAYEHALKLWNLDAIGELELADFKSKSTVAQVKSEKNLISQGSAHKKVQAAINKLTTFTQTAKDQSGDFVTGLNILNQELRSRNKKIQDLKNIIADKSTQRIEIKTTIPGFVTSTPIHMGRVVEKGQVLCSISPKDSHRLFAYVPEKLKSRIHVGQPVSIKIDDSTIEGTVESIDPKIILSPPQLRIRGTVAAGSYFFKVQLKPDEKMSHIFPGQIGKVLFR